MGRIEWAIWANENAIASSLVAILGGIIALAGQFNLWQIGGYALFIGILTLLLEYPRSKRQKGHHHHDRRFQYLLSVLISKGGLLTRNYFIRFVFYLVICVPCCFTLQTLIGAACFMITAFIYLAAAVNGEEWQQIPLKKAESTPKIIAEPRRPPPRRPDGRGDGIQQPHQSHLPTQRPSGGGEDSAQPHQSRV